MECAGGGHFDLYDKSEFTGLIVDRASRFLARPGLAPEKAQAIA